MKRISLAGLALLLIMTSSLRAQAGELYDAAKNGDIVKVRQLLQQGADVNARDRFLRTPLYVAASEGNTDVVKLLIEKGADVNARDEFQETPLYVAADRGNTDVAKLLIEKGADVNGREKVREQTALIRAATHGKDEVVKLLLARGADPHVSDCYGATALMYASANGNATTVKALLDGGADVNARDNRGKSALTDAASGNLPDIVRVLIAKGAAVDTKDLTGATAWSYAAERGFGEVAAILKSAGAKEAYEALGWSEQYSGVTEPQAATITNRSMWQDLWTKLLHRPAPLDIDFTRYVAVCIFLGTRPTGGYGVEFGTPYEEGGKMVIPFRERKSTGFVTQALSQPFAIRVFERKDDLGIVLKKENNL